MVKRNQFENYAIRLLKRILIKYLKYIGKKRSYIYLSISFIKGPEDKKCYIGIHNEHWEGGKDYNCPVDRIAWEDTNE